MPRPHATNAPKVLEVVRHASGKIPKFDSVANEPIHDRLAGMMRTVLVDDDVPSYLDAQAAEYLFSALETFRDLGLDNASFLVEGRDTHVLTWTGTEMNSVLAFALTAAGLECEVLDIGITVFETTPDTVAAFLEQIANAPLPIEDIAEFVENLRTAKFDELVPEGMLRQLWAAAHVEEAAKLPGLLGRMQGDLRVAR